MFTHADMTSVSCRASPKQEPVISDCEIEDLKGRERGVDGAVSPQGEAQQADEEGCAIPP